MLKIVVIPLETPKILKKESNKLLIKRMPIKIKYSFVFLRIFFKIYHLTNYMIKIFSFRT